MVKSSVPPETGETVCPACGAGIKVPAISRRRRVQCPKCREVVFIGSVPPPEPEVAPASPQTPDAGAEARRRIELLEARVEALEAALSGAMAAARNPPSGAAQRKLLWVTTTPGRSPDFSPEQGQALFHNLGGVRSQAITIRTPAGDLLARAHAEWFKTIFERAGWTVHGPEEIIPHATLSGLSLAVPELPVAKEVAATYFALKAAGFETVAVLDTAPGGTSGKETAAISLTMPSEKAA